MNSLLNKDAKIISSRIAEFSNAWNAKDLNELSKFVANNITYSNPPIKIGFFNLSGKELSGKFEVLKFWRNFFEKYKSDKEDKEIQRIKRKENGYIAVCKVKNEKLGVSSTAVFEFNVDFLITRLSFSDIVSYKSDRKLSGVHFLYKLIKRQFSK